MALQTTGDIMTEVLVRNNRTTTDSFITDTMLQDWLRDAHAWATALKPWPFTEGRYSTTYTTGTGENSDEWFIEGYKADTIRLVTVGGKRLQKVNFSSYQRFREDYPEDTNRIFSDYGRLVYVNPKIDVSGTMTVWGQYQPLIDPTDLTAETVFTSWNVEGNEAIVEKMTAYLKLREHLPDEADIHDNRASAKLLEIFGRLSDEQSNYQDNKGMYERFDVLNGGFADDLNSNQFN